MAEKRDNSGTLGRNRDKQNDNHPDHKGQCTIGGVDYWISAWIKTKRDDGSQFFSLAFKRKDQRQGGAPAPRRAAAAPTPIDEPPMPADDDVPF